MSCRDTTVAARLFHTVEGSGPRTLLLIHGEACDSDDWSPQIEPFATRHRLIAPDLPGHGRSTSARHGHTPFDFAHDVAGLLSTTGTGPVVAVGHSAGAVIASVLAVERPDLVEGVVAVNPRYGMQADRAAAMAASVRVPDPPQAMARLLADEEGTPSGPGGGWLRAWHRRRALGSAGDTVARMIVGLCEERPEPTVRPAAEAYLRRRTCPVLTIRSRASLEAWHIEADWDRSVSAHPYSTSVVWDDVGHWLHQERPDEFNALVLDWTARLPNASAGTAEDRSVSSH
ncbi:alpha/beta hydrolase [Streptomyces sp. NPDC005811]|uniref:alpha/beta fold hydrolase n=1 Tax=Streptomyces sp. NPDC005811 TaxID=3154565 RepID=UPI0033EC8CBF